MDAVAGPRKLAWTMARVTSVVPRTPRIKSFFFALPQPPAFVPGQHMDVRLVAPDGYEAQRSYSIASAPEHADALELAVERLQDGEVSPFFHDEVRVGDEIELRGPIGGHFMWSVRDGGPLLLVGGGSGVVPLASMIRHHAAQGSEAPVTLAVSARTAPDLLYLDELRGYAAARRGFTLLATVTREAPGHNDLRRGRIDRELLAEALRAGGSPLLAFVCGANAFVETVSGLLLDLGVAPDRIRTERYGG
ncbi:MAG TPA: FAD-binding oxidoreductase [Candidatus Eisenbacteria bacterium]|nr:FAD-binding oxidoreductase [Candidatus Eisenbacteria bacterium]